MAATTKGQITLVNAQGNSRVETFTMTPTDGEYVTFSSTGTTTLKIQPGGESIVGINFNNDGATTVNTAYLFADGQDIRCKFMMALYAIDNAPVPIQLPGAISIRGGRELSISVNA